MTASTTSQKDADTGVDDDALDDVDVDDDALDDEDLDIDDDALDDVNDVNDVNDVLTIGASGTDDDGDEDEDDDVEAGDLSADATSKRPRRTKAGDDEGMDLEEEHHPDDVEEPLDVVLRERTATPEETDDTTGDTPADGPRRITPRGSDEFLCSSCFLVLPRNQLADAKRQLCRDCV